MSTPTSEELRKTDAEYGDKLRALIRHENEVSNHRVTWLMVTEGLLVTSVSAVFKESLVATGSLAVVGILVSVSVGQSLKNSYESRQHFKKLWRKRIEDRKYDEDDVLPLDGGYKGNKAITWLLPGTFIPKLVVVAWVGVLGHVIFQGLK